MKDRRGTSWRCCGESGLTLVEVLAALAILGTLLAGVLIAQGRMQRQWARAKRQMAAVEVADRLLTRWHQGSGVPPPGRTGSATPELLWRTRAVEAPAAARLRSRVVRVELLDLHAGGRARPLVSVDVLSPMPQPKGKGESN